VGTVIWLKFTIKRKHKKKKISLVIVFFVRIAEQQARDNYKLRSVRPARVRYDIKTTGWRASSTASRQSEPTRYETHPIKRRRIVDDVYDVAGYILITRKPMSDVLLFCSGARPTTLGRRPFRRDRCICPGCSSWTSNRSSCDPTCCTGIDWLASRSRPNRILRCWSGEPLGTSSPRRHCEHTPPATTTVQINASTTTRRCTRNRTRSNVFERVRFRCVACSERKSVRTAIRNRKQTVNCIFVLHRLVELN